MVWAAVMASSLARFSKFIRINAVFWRTCHTSWTGHASVASLAED